MAQTQSSDLTLTVAKLAALFSSLAAGLYTAMQIESAPVVDLFLSGAPLVAVILWLKKDVTRTGVGAVQDFDYFFARLVRRHSLVRLQDAWARRLGTACRPDASHHVGRGCANRGSLVDLRCAVCRVVRSKLTAPLGASPCE
jgi:hypothetical protein